MKDDETIYVKAFDCEICEAYVITTLDDGTRLCDDCIKSLKEADEDIKQGRISPYIFGDGEVKNKRKRKCISSRIMPHDKYLYTCQLSVSTHNKKKHIAIIGNNDYRVKASWNITDYYPIIEEES